MDCGAFEKVESYLRGGRNAQLEKASSSDQRGKYAAALKRGSEPRFAVKRVRSKGHDRQAEYRAVVDAERPE